MSFLRVFFRDFVLALAILFFGMAAAVAGLATIITLILL